MEVTVQRTLLLLLTATLLRLQNAPSREFQPPPAPYAVAEAYEVYSALVPDDWLVKEAHTQTVLIRAETRPYSMCLKPEDEAETRRLGPAIEDYRTENEKTWLLQRKFDLDRPYDILSSDEMTGSFLGGIIYGGPDFHARYPTAPGWMEFSAVGFNAEMTLAVVYLGHHCGGLCGGGGFAVLQKEAGKWKRVTFRGRSCFWAS
jgi:hypothetical protein